MVKGLTVPTVSADPAVQADGTVETVETFLFFPLEPFHLRGKVHPAAGMQLLDHFMK